MSSSANSNDAKRDAEESTNRVSESLQHAGHSIKQAFVGGTGTEDTVKETTTHASNRVGEVANRVGDAISGKATDAKNA